MRPSRRQPDELRAISLERGVVKYAEGSCFVKFGDTHVLVTATLEDRLPPWLKGQARGWVTAEYGMLPRATSERTRREASAGKQSGRTIEIQRLIGRSLRAVLDLPALGIPTMEDYVAMYCERTGRAGIPQLDWYFAYNMFRLAAILQGIIGRVRDGTAASAHAEANAERVVPLAQAAHGFAQRAGML